MDRALERSVATVRTLTTQYAISRRNTHAAHPTNHTINSFPTMFAESMICDRMRHYCDMMRGLCWTKHAASTPEPTT